MNIMSGARNNLSLRTAVIPVYLDYIKRAKTTLSFHLLPPRRPLHQTLREIGHGFELPSYIYKLLHKQSFLTNCLFK